MKEKVIGIMGGMGPEAGIDLFSRITSQTHAKCDTDHLHVILDSNPKMPSRQDAILRGGESPVPAMIATAQNLVRAGADVIIIGANTAHYFYDEVAAAVEVPFLHIIDEAVKETIRQVPGIQKVGVMATTAAMQARVYEKSCGKFDVEVLCPAPEVQDVMQKAIFDHDFGFKYNGRTKECVAAAVSVAEHLIARGAEALIMGCTEIPLILGERTFAVPVIDPNEIIACAAVKYAKGLE
ncbi:cysteate racemase [Dysosmobacter sp.]